jgi:hypothetical protein
LSSVVVVSQLPLQQNPSWPALKQGVLALAVLQSAVQLPPLQAAPPGQVLPQVPQFCGSPSNRLQVEPQQMPLPLTAAQAAPAWELAQSSVTHAVPLQLSPVGQSPVAHGMYIPPSGVQFPAQDQPLGQMSP